MINTLYALAQVILFIAGSMVLALGVAGSVILFKVAFCTYEDYSLLRGRPENMDELDQEELDPSLCRLNELRPCFYQDCPWGVDFEICPEYVIPGESEIRSSKYVRDG